jgi:stearoyl-CoA desaturase (delta-9 desaturase)
MITSLSQPATAEERESMGNTTTIQPKYTFSWGTASFFVFLHLGAALALLPSLFSWSGVAVAVLFYWLTASLGVCLGYHRYLTHRSLDVPKWVAYTLVTFGALSCENGPLKWVGQHRMHHAGSDTERDPHNAVRGFWWSHMGWMLFSHMEFDNKAVLLNYTKDINDDKYYQFLDKYFVLIQTAMGLAFLAIGGWSWVVWGIFLRLVVVYHVTWLVNSASHMFGYKNFKLEADLSTNCWWVGLLAFGEGWHNNHHAFAQSARHGLRPWEIDLTWMFISLLSALGLAKNIKVVELSPAGEASSNQTWFTGKISKAA